MKKSLLNVLNVYVKKGITREMDPKSVITVGETMSPHPSLIEVIMWTQAYYEHRWQ